MALGLLGLLPLSPALEAQTPLPARVELDYTFGQRMRFILEPESPFPIVEAILYYTLPDMELPQRVRIVLGSQTPSQILHERDLRRDPLPPFAPLTFWWEVQDRDGNWWSTERRTVRYLDNRVAWRTISAGPLRLYWHAGDPGLARSALELARQSLDRIGGPLGYRTTEPIELFWYADRELARAAFRLAGLEIGGEVRPRWRAVILIASADGAGLETLRRLIPHELTHVILEDVAGGQPLPAWLDEGWALLNEGWPDPALLRALQEPRLEGVSLASLCGDFPSDPLRAPQAYALSWAVVRYIQDREGTGGLRRLLEAYAEGVSCENGVRRVLGRSLARLEDEAEAAFQPQPPWRFVMESLGPWLLLFLLLSLGPALLAFSQRSEARIQSP
ncbi:peptidase MA family metallohydrolase [Thermoflexus sp.]|uniref:peptidase MA family metallohydrolase n=1 Tax=Thermoflexus sp. TaxID=1969742 RepID=UPI0025E427CE|nr:peptidase MA family metallohydrolase [Thermoflexus sp.]MDW8180641.1 peptidase MA family metallohydrolase [Anaerolineae bacterium]MCS6964219.1 peptidase MA family metallohydrolase [Thermoflexus sp.]MCS7351187.1 peptidase MA family metallohydrolase [Thermoflexus sp.]MCX7690832.1 peptidase MA family metallohydrolase [Thermoflexus sp.]MDW8185927.1 peptidase MA family metallohydrolase [Anaerolineae bacterium]